MYNVSEMIKFVWSKVPDSVTIGHLTNDPF